MQNTDRAEDDRNSSSDNAGNGTEAAGEQPTDFSTEIMSVTEMEQSPDGSPDATEETTQDSKIPNVADLTTTDIEANFPPEYEKFWKAVVENPQDFTGWVYLLQYVEQENHLLAARKAFDNFFTHYPYCYGYWKKYADLEKRHSNIKQSDEVYRRGLQAIPLSVDLWIHYINFLKETLDPADPETNSSVRGTYEHAVLAAGTDFRSDRLWEMYINWENEQGNLREVTAIYDRILGIPTQLYSHHFQRFKEHVQNNLPRDLLSSEQFIQLRRELASVNGHNGEAAPPGADFPSGTEDITDPAKLITEIENMRHRIIEIHQEMFNHNEHEVSKRWTFEEGIKRPYFHVKPLEKAQLKNWKEYLEFEIENGTHERVVVLFERCVISCALYEDFWIKYAKYMENHSIEGVRHVYSRACTIHLPKKPMVHVLWAAFEEQQGNINEARRILKTFEECVVGLAMVRLRRVSLERRHGNMEEAEHLLMEAVKNAKSRNELSFYTIKLARHLFKVQKNLPKARTVLSEAIEKDKENTKLYLNLLEMEYSGDLKQNEENILSCFDKAVSGALSIKVRITFSQRKVEFLEDFGSDVSKLLDAYSEHQALLKEQDSLKRKAENGSEEPDEKKVHTDDATMASTQMMDGDMQANQMAYNYSAWYQYNYQNAWTYGQYYPPPPT
ncbi:pre-mRNA-processing factor 39 isoform X1 [Alligator mississippiensis]|uniref:pre-mRNA-processing factor 39 isoform X1 n=1 Tax=Alligator mississippiensis TaxID=8496 RepID=UPI0028777453|nr:pre-mRNA-processing factor 39 isoform X1 [Alligator mississippiensis]XP_019351457.2 pre-mRNA-processing factor 39 isoform X1 [Alligator mississippiensis]XP_019351463.2 pre-mRNA-processing factor 39 isoform X1 [Alligator mississippiensis]